MMNARNAIRLKLLYDISDLGSKRRGGFMSKSETRDRNGIDPQQTVEHSVPFVIMSVELRALRLV